MSWLSSLPADVKKKLGYAAALVGLGVIFGWSFRGCLAPIVGEKPPVEQHGMGWRDEPDHVKQVVASFARPFFGDAGKTIIQGADDKDAFLWKYYEKIHGHPWKPHNQNGTGCCVGEGFSAGVEILAAVEIVVNNEPQEYKDVSASAVYALSREVGNYLVNNDGSTGADAAKALMQYGALSCEEAGDDNYTNPAHAQKAKLWGKKGLPADLKAKAAKHKIKSASLVRTPEEVRAALINGYPVPICSSVGFEPRGGFKRDADGFCAMGGSWAHCMVIVGYRADKKAFLVLQSWGDNSPPGPKSLDQPDGSFWITWEACQKIVRSGESYALSSFDGYPARNIDVFIAKPMPRDVAIVPARVRRLLEFPLSP